MDLYLKNHSFWSFWAIFRHIRRPLQPSWGPPLLRKTVFKHIIIFWLKKIEKIGCSVDVFPKNQSFWAFWTHFWQLLGKIGAPTGKLRAPFFSTNCIITYNYIFFANNLKNWMFIACIPKKSLISAIFDLFWAVFGHIRGPYGQTKGPFYFQILYFNIQLYFLFEWSQKFYIHCMYTQKITHFGHFWPILGSFFCIHAMNIQFSGSFEKKI